VPGSRDLERQWVDAVAQLEADIADLESKLAECREAKATKQPLHKRLHESRVNEPSMEKSHRLAISEGHKGDADLFAKAIRKAGFSQNSLAKRLRINQALISLHRKKVRKIPMSRAKDIESLTGWPADAKHWPCGIVSDGE
jgi:ribosome-binding protein aMBF1 (putative translation factor)